MEEVVAKLGAAFLCTDLELALEPREENASCIANWLEVLKNDTRAIFSAARAVRRRSSPQTQCRRRAGPGGLRGIAASSTVFPVTGHSPKTALNLFPLR